SDVTPTAEIAGAAYVQQSLQSTLGSFGPIFIAVSMSLFAFTTLIGNYSYCEGCLRYLLRKEPSKAVLFGFRIVASLLVLLGAVVQMGLVWNTADMLQGLMVVIHIPVIVILAGTAVKTLKDYLDQKNAGADPVFKASSIGIKEKTDFWN
ncbi:MAG: alanine:cation symporter family protein, partial [Spirochaetaceae bacterium]|nr:alanine:cation symporter family protein [Spirochaetaceae bacterium]